MILMMMMVWFHVGYLLTLHILDLSFLLLVFIDHNFTLVFYSHVCFNHSRVTLHPLSR